jgi:predicted ribosome quality control (RQC) complex YloA/Tae2 family protein
MSLKSNELKRYLADLKPILVGRHLAHPLFYTGNTLFFHLSGEHYHRFVIALDDAEPRFYVAPNGLDVPSLDSKFLDQIKKDLSNAYLVDIEQCQEDRIIKFSLTIINSVFKEEGRSLYLELIPHHANLIETDLSDKVIAAYRPGEMSDERPFLRGMNYILPEKKDFAPLPDSPFSFEEYEAHCLTLEANLSEQRKKDRFGFVLDQLKRRKKLAERKIKAIEGDIANAKIHENDGEYGDYIFTEYSSLNPRATSISIDGKEILLDPSRNLAKNAELFYKRAKKAKETIKLSEQNLSSAKQEALDAASALAQIDAADEEGLENLAKELDLHPENAPKAKKEKEWRGLSHESLPYEVEVNGTKILYGKSAKQNDCLTFLFDTAKEHSWLHIMGNSGSHVMVKKENASDEEIRTAAEICLLNSNQVDGEVMLTKRGNVRKGQVMGQAIVKEFKTLRIDSIRPQTAQLLQTAKKVNF